MFVDLTCNPNSTMRWNLFLDSKLENILKGSLDSIPSPSTAKIQIMDRKVCLRCKDKTLLGVVNSLLKTESLLTLPRSLSLSKCLSQVKFSQNTTIYPKLLYICSISNMDNAILKIELSYILWKWRCIKLTK